MVEYNVLDDETDLSVVRSEIKECANDETLEFLQYVFTGFFGPEEQVDEVKKWLLTDSPEWVDGSDMVDKIDEMRLVFELNMTFPDEGARIPLRMLCSYIFDYDELGPNSLEDAQDAVTMLNEQYEGGSLTFDTEELESPENMFSS